MVWLRELKYLIKKQFYSDKNSTIFQKWKQSLLAIIFALFLSFILIGIKKQNPFLVFLDVIYGSFQNNDSFQQTLLYFSMFLIAGMAIIIGFKSGLFNIGIAGQMLISGALIIILAVKFSLPWPLLLLLGMIFAGICASISGALKSIFNIHEVVSTILLNWIFFYISQYLLGSSMSWMNDLGSSKPIDKTSQIIIGDSKALPSILIAISFLLLIIIIFSKTKWGFALKSVGQNVEASRYAGIRVTFQMMLGMFLSGMAAGMLAAINYLGRFSSMSYSTSTSLPSIGFQGISVALISFSSFYGLIPAAIFWAILSSGIDYASIINPQVPKEILSLMNGLIIYSIAISIIFIRFRPIKIIVNWIIKMKSDEIKQELEKYRKLKNDKKVLFKSLYQKTFINMNANNVKVVKIIQEMKKQRKKIINGIKRKSFKFLLKNLLRKKQIKEIELSQILKKLYENLDNINKLIYDNQLKLSKSIIKKNNKMMDNSFKILKKEYIKRVSKIQLNIKSKFWFNRVLNNYKIKQENNKYFNAKYAILKLDFKKKISMIKKNYDRQNRKFKKRKLLISFNNNVNKIMIESGK